MSWIINTKNGNKRCTIYKLEYSGRDKGERCILFNIASPEPIKWEIGDYIVYRNEKFTLNYMPTEEKKAARKTSGEAFIYQNVKMNSCADELARCDFLDFVKSGKNVNYNASPVFSFYAETVQELSDRIKVNLDRIYKEEEEWKIVVDKNNTTLRTGRYISVNNVKCLEAIGLAYTEFGAGFTIHQTWDAESGKWKKTIDIGRNVEMDGNLSYGKNEGLIRLRRTANSDQLLISRLRAYGSSRNLPSRFYNKLEKSNGGRYISESMYLTNLMLPGFPGGYAYEKEYDEDSVKVSYDNTDVYIQDAKVVDDMGVREGCVCFDGQGDTEEIYPTLEGMKDKSGNPLDVVLSAVNPTDNGFIEEPKDYVVGNVSRERNGSLYSDTSESLRYDYHTSERILPGVYGVGGKILVKSTFTSELVDTYSLSVFTNVGYRYESGVYRYLNAEQEVSTQTFTDGVAELKIITEDVTLEAEAEIIELFVKYTVKQTITFKEGVSEEDKGTRKTFTQSLNGTIRVSENLKSDFTVFIRDPNFDIKAKDKDGEYLYIQAGSSPSIAFKSGACAGREFELLNCKAAEENNIPGYLLTLKRVEDSSIQMFFPNSRCPVSGNDKFAILNISMPEEYVKQASGRLLQAAREYYRKNCLTRYTYEPEIDQIYIQNNRAKVEKYLSEGNVLNFKDEDMGIAGSVYISTLSIKEGEGILPIYSVTLNEEDQPGFIRRITESVSSQLVASGGADVNVSQVNQAIEKYGGSMFIYKNKDDEAKGVINFKNGIQLSGRALTNFLTTENQNSPASDLNVYSALRTSNSFLRKDIEDTAEKKIIFSEGLVARQPEAISLSSEFSHALTLEGSDAVISENDLFEEVENTGVLAAAVTEQSVNLDPQTIGSLYNVSDSADSAANNSLLTMQDGTWVPEKGTSFLNRIAPSGGFATLGSDGKLTESQRPALADGSVTTAKIADGIVTADKLCHDLAANMFPSVFRDRNDANACLQPGVYVNVNGNVPVQSGTVDQMGSLVVTHHNTWWDNTMKGTLILVKQEVTFCDRSDHSTRKYYRYVDAFVPYETYRTRFQLYAVLSDWTMEDARIQINLEADPEQIWNILYAHPNAQFSGYTFGKGAIYDLSVSWIQAGEKVEVSWYDHMSKEIIILSKSVNGVYTRSEEYIEYITI